MRMHLSIEKEDGSISIHPVDQQAAYVIGRNKKECDIVCDHKSCSRKHACIAHHPEGKVYLVDLGSAHGENRLYLTVFLTLKAVTYST